MIYTQKNAVGMAYIKHIAMYSAMDLVCTAFKDVNMRLKSPLTSVYKSSAAVLFILHCFFGFVNRLSAQLMRLSVVPNAATVPISEATRCLLIIGTQVHNWRYPTIVSRYHQLNYYALVR